MNVLAPSERERAVDGIGIALLALLPLIWRYPFQNLPFIDDWCYAWTVEHLLTTGEFRILEYSSSPLATHALWGALFAKVAGFSFAVLRMSTWVLSVSGLIAFYLLLRDLGVARRATLAGVAALAVYPIYAVLSLTYMTDVPFLALTLWAVWATNRGLTEQRTGWLIAGAVLVALSAGIRSVAVVLPIATAMVLLLHTKGWGRSVWRIAIALSPLVAVAVLQAMRGDITVFSADISNVTSSPPNRIKDLPYGVAILPEMLISAVSSILGIVGIALLPITLSVLRRADAGKAVLFGVVAVAITLALDQVLKLRMVYPLHFTQTWSLGEVGATEQGVPEDWFIEVPLWVTWGFIFLGSCSSAVLFRLPLRRLLRPDMALIAWFCAGYIVLSALLWLTHDRYFLVLVPFAIAIALTAQSMRRTWVAVATIGLFAAISVVGLRDHLLYNATLWQAVAELQAKGVPPADIDGGYMVNGWLQYAHPEQANRNAAGDIRIPWLNVVSDDEPRPYLIADRPRDDRPTLQMLPYDRVIGLSGAIYILGPVRSK